MAEIAVMEDPQEQRFLIVVNGEVAGFMTYEVRPDAYALMHTEIETSREGQGLGSTLIRSTLDTLRVQGLGVLPYCPFVRAFLKKHPDYVDVVPASHRSVFGLPEA